jgi:hypothetical protein
MMRRRSGPSVGVLGNVVADPTQNVLDVIEAVERRFMDLRQADAALMLAQLGHLQQIISMSEVHAEKYRVIEERRLNAIREVDGNAVARASEVAELRAATLASQVAASAETLRGQVEAARIQTSAALAQALDPILADLRTLRDWQANSLGGREQVSDRRLDIGQALVIASLLVGVIGLVITMIVVFG